MIFAKGEFITKDDLPDLIRSSSIPMVENESLETALNEFEKQYITIVLNRFKFDKEKSSETLKISLPTLYRRIKDLGIKEHYSFLNSGFINFLRRTPSRLSQLIFFPSLFRKIFLDRS